ncbi:MAG: hypothetical protein B6A08_16705 [Sorangiineae bacterium NIC37A_2]|jgi:DNA-binding MarR family transcriptional regulator|nr:MAG: hypothetical protein B6A08_16705 [Sorangiineae bacterium NIC37A_2]
MSSRPDAAESLGPALAFLERLWALNHALEQLSGQMAKRLGVTAQQRLIIRCVGKFPGVPAGQLASLLHLDPGTISASLARLEAKGLIERKRDQKDQRRTWLGLTDAGRALDCSTPGTVECAVEALLAGTHVSDIEATARVLSSLRAHLEQQLEP